MLKRLLILGTMLAAVAANAGTINVTSPNEGDYLGRSNQLSFTITGSNAQAKVKAVVTNNADSSISFSFQQDFTPNVDHEISGSLNLNFNDATPEGSYKIVVSVTEPGNPYNSKTINEVFIDVVNPKFRDVAPANGGFVRGNVNIRAELEESNIDEWRVQINGQDIPNNTGSTASVSVLWNTAGIIRDGQQSISIRVEDKASNTNTKSISVTVDRIPPTVDIASPTISPYRPRATIPVIINFNDQFPSALLLQNVDVLIKDLNNNTIGRVARKSVRQSGNSLQWSGLIKYNSNMPTRYKVVVTAIDRAGNPAITQEVIVNTTGR